MPVLIDHASGPVARKVRPFERILVRVHAHRLDSDLARGISPDATAALALRAQMLVSTQVRSDLARSAQRIMAAAQGPAGGRLPVPVCRDRVRHSLGEFADLVCGLLAAGPVPARGVAKASILLGDARGPLYHRASADDLPATLREAAQALRPRGNW
jgi:hypothetical protein